MVAWTCTCTRMYERLMRCLNLLSFFVTTEEEYLFCHFSPSRTIEIASAFNDLFVVARIEYLIELKFFIERFSRVALKCHKACSYSEQNNDWFDFCEGTARIAIKNKSNLIHFGRLNNLKKREDGNWGFHLIYLCRRMVIHLNLYSQPIAFSFSACHPNVLWVQSPNRNVDLISIFLHFSFSIKTS